ncbi:MAG: Stp1/IreP family PP2C-type Ser/Thr phosphatase [Kouleothrix sp.]|jgi:protein phosphatase|nr:Stp1/IreP family PP2C-type Ser/Thr phosphatase [Kouleothrix sp.]
MSDTCPSCGAPVQQRSRFCPACGRALAPPAPPAAAPPREAEAPLEVALHSPKHVSINGESLNLRELINVVESGVHWWQGKLTSVDIATREQAAESIEELSRVLHSLAKQLAQGRETIRITTRLPVLRSYGVGCPACGRGNRAGAKYCLGCGALLDSQAQPETLTETPMPLRFKIAARTDQGKVRRNNQDSIYTGSFRLRGGTARLCLVADGMGGAKAGEQASRIASEVAQAQIQREADGQPADDDSAWQSLLRNAARAANRRVYEESRVDDARKGMGTTLTIALVVGERLHIASVGDSRAYLLNAGGVTKDGATTAQLTSDHSLVARLVDIGQITPEQARTHPQRNLLYRSIGTDPSVEVDTLSEQLEPGDVVLLCSDGLFNHVRDDEIAQIALEQTDPNHACERLVALANERGGRDNISVVLVRVEGTKASEKR